MSTTLTEGRVVVSVVMLGSRSFARGQLVRFLAQFTDDATGTPTDPSNLVFAYSVNGGPPVEWSYQADLGTNQQVIRDGTGSYYVDVDTTPMTGGITLTGQFRGTGIAQATGSIAVDVNERPL